MEQRTTDKDAGEKWWIGNADTDPLDSEPFAESDVDDCRRPGLRCVDCLPRKLWCDLCIERHAARVTPPVEKGQADARP